MLSVIIPSKTEKYFKRTIEDVLEKSTSEIEIYAVTDGYIEEDIVNDPRAIYLPLEYSTSNQKRHGINKAVSLCSGDYVMALDAHCMVDKGFDTQLIKDHQPNWVLIPQRRRLDAANWCEQDQCGRPPIAYEYFMWDPLFKNHELHGYKWDFRTLERQDIMIDDTAEFQGSCWFMSRDWFNKCGFMQIEGYTGWGSEAEEIALKTRQMGGFVKTDKNTNYYHLHKGKTYGRMYHLNKSEQKASWVYAYNHWVVENKDFFIKYINSFPPMPNWPTNWESQLYGK
jgi:glycosyltransferase involved in cell wall biosynthesis